MELMTNTFLASIQLKDYLALAISLCGLMLSVTAFARTLVLERTLYYEPYFKKHWPAFAKKLKVHMEAAALWCWRIKSGPDVRGLYDYVLETYDTDGAQIELDATLSKFNRNISNELRRYLDAVSKLNDALRGHDRLAYSSDRVMLQCLALGVFEGQSEESIQNRRRNVVMLQEVVKQYLGEFDYKKDIQQLVLALQSNPRFQNDLRKYKKKIQDGIVTLEARLKELEKTVEIISAKYPSPNDQ